MTIGELDLEAEGNQQAAWFHFYAALRVGDILEHADHRAAFAEFLHFVVANEKWSEVACVGVGQHPAVHIKNGIEECGVAIVRSVAEYVAIQA